MSEATFNLSDAFAAVKHGESARRSILAGSARDVKRASTTTTTDRARDDYLSTRGKRDDGSPDWDALALARDIPTRFAAYVRSARMSRATATTDRATIRTTVADAHDGLNLGMLGYDRADILADAVEIALNWSATLTRDADEPETIHPALTRRLAIKRERERAQRAGIDPREVLPFTLGEMYRAIRSAYKRGLNVFGYWRGGRSVATVNGAGLTLTPSESVKWDRIVRNEQQREQREQRAREDALIAAGWNVERRTIDPERADRLAALVECYPANARRVPLVFAQALVAGHTVGAILDAIEQQTGKRPAEATLTRWAARLSALTGETWRNPAAAPEPVSAAQDDDEAELSRHREQQRIRRYVAHQLHKRGTVAMHP